MNEFILLALVIVFAFLIVFSKAMECFFCGSREVASRTALGTKGLCDKCRSKGKKLP